MRVACRVLAATGIGVKQIGVLMATTFNWKKPLTVDTLKKRYGEDIEYGRSRLMAAAGMSWSRLIAAGDLGAIKWAQTVFGGEEFRIKREPDEPPVDPAKLLLPVDPGAPISEKPAEVLGLEDVTRDYFELMRPKVDPSVVETVPAKALPNPSAAT